MTHDEEAQGWPTASGHWGQDACPGSFNMERAIPEEPPTSDALFGIRVHECIAGGLKYESLTDEEKECVDRTAHRIGVILDQCGFGGGEPTERETRLWLAHKSEDPGDRIDQLLISGKPDVVYMRPNRLLIIDAKSGRNTVPLNHVNKQLRRLAVLCRRNFGVNEIWVAIAQPWAAHQPPCKYTAEDLALAELEMWRELIEAMEPDAPLVAGPWCHYCRARAVCPKSREILSIVARTIQPLEGANVIERMDKRLAICSGATLAEMGQQCEAAEIVIAAVKSEMKRRLAADPDSVPGWTLEPGNERSEIIDAQKAFEAVARKITETEFRACCTVWPGKLKKAWCLAVGANGKAKESAIADLEQLLGPWLEKKQNQPSLKRKE